MGRGTSTRVSTSSFGPSPSVSILEKDTPYRSVSNEKGIDTFTDYGHGYGDWAPGAKITRDEQGAIGYATYLVETLKRMSPD